PGRPTKTPPAAASNGCSQPTRRAPKWAAPIRKRSKSHNHCETVLGGGGGGGRFACPGPPPRPPSPFQCWEPEPRYSHAYSRTSWLGYTELLPNVRGNHVTSCLRSGL